LSRHHRRPAVIAALATTIVVSLTPTAALATSARTEAPRTAAPPARTVPAQTRQDQTHQVHGPQLPRDIAAAAAAPAGPATYAYDAAGRLTGVTHTGGESARYEYDAADNVTRIDRFPSTQLSVFSVVPQSAPRGSTITVHGTGFAATPAGNTVKIGDVAATVSAATATALTLTVPANAGTGPVSVKVGAATVTGPVFTVPGPAPTITSVSPTSGVPTTEVTITGTGFAADGPSNVVSFNGQYAELLSATATALRVRVPHTSTGPVRVATPLGTAEAPDFVVPPTGVDPALIESFTRLTPGGPAQTVRITRGGNDAVLLVTAPESGRISIGSTEMNYNGFLKATVIDPVGEPLPEFDQTVLTSDNLNIDMAGLKPGKTYQILLDPSSGNGTGQATFQASEPLAGALTTTGAGFEADLRIPGQNARLTFDAAAGQVLSLGFTGSSMTNKVYVQVFDPNGRQVGDRFEVGTRSNDSLDLAPLAVAGEYSVVLNPGSAGVGRVTTTLSVRNNAGVATRTDAGVAVAFQRPGQDAVVEFDGAVDEFVSLGITGTQLAEVTDLYVLDPTGARVAQDAIATRELMTLRLPKLTTAGRYTALFRPRRSGLGQFTVTYSARVDAGRLTTTGAAVTATMSRAGQEAVLSFDAAAGDVLSLGFTNNTFASQFFYTVRDPSGAQVERSNVSGRRNSEADLAALPVAGRYTVYLDPDDAATGSVQVTLSAPVAAGSLTVGGPARTVTITRAGQDARLTFAGTTGQRLDLSPAANTIPEPSNVYLVRPDGTREFATSLSNRPGQLPNLPATGTYQLIIDPTLAATGHVNLQLLTRAAAARGAAPPRTTSSGRAEPSAAAGPRPGTSADQPQAGAASGGPGPKPGSATDTSLTWVPDAKSLSGADWSTRRPPVAKPSPLRAKRGVTALSGHTFTIDGKPLAGVRVTAGAVSATTDRTGRFLLSGLPGGATTFVVDGGTANSGARKFGLYTIQADAPRGRTTVLPYTIWLQQLDTAHLVRIASPTTAETVLTTPQIPGLEVRIPAGSVVRDSAGKVVTELGITPIPVDRPPFPLPVEPSVSPVYFTVQPGGTFVFPEGASVIYPNHQRLAAGTTVEFKTYDPEHRGWHVYGHGTVTRDGRQIVPDAKTRAWSFQMMSAFHNPLGWDNSLFDDLVDWLSGDPVDVSTGLMVDAHTDLTVPDTMPLAVTRHYFQGDDKPRAFGIGQSSAYDLFLYRNPSTPEWTEFDLYLPGGGKVHFPRSTPGTGSSGAVFTAQGTAGEFRGAVARCNSDPCLTLGFVVTKRDGTKLYFGDNPTALIAVEDRHGNRTRIVRNRDNEVSQVDSPNGRSLRFTHDEAHRVKTVRDSAGRTVTYDYDATGRLKTVTGPGTRTLSYTYTAEGRLLTAKDARGITYVTNEFNDAGRVKKQTLTDGQVYEFGYTTDAAGKVTATQVTQPNGAVRRFTFNAAGAVLSDTAAYGTPLAQTTSYERNAANIVTAVVDHGARRTSLKYDDDGNLESATALAGTGDATTSGVYTYGGPFDQPLRYTDQNGKVTRYGYEDDGDLKTVTDPLNRVSTYRYTASGQLKSVRDPAGRTTTLHYRDGDLTEVENPDGTKTRQFTDVIGRVVSVTDPLGATTAVRYDDLNQAREITDALGRVTKLDYDNNGNLTALTDPRSKVNGWTYDDSDRPITWTDPLGNVERTAYTPSKTTVTARSGKVTVFDSDLLGRVQKVSYGVNGNTAESSVTAGYDRLGRLETLTDTAASGVTRFGYDKLDRVASAAKPEGTTSYTYWPTGEVRTATTTGQPAVEYGYDASGAPTDVTQGSVKTEFKYDGHGVPDKLLLPGGWSQKLSRDEAGRVTGITYLHGTTTKGALSYGYDATGRITSTAGSFARVGLPGPRSFEYDAANRLTKVGGTAVTNDADGNLRSDGTSTYNWNARGQLTGITGGTTAGFGYGATGERTRRTVGGSVTDFLGERGQPAQEKRGTAVTSLLSGGTDAWFHRAEPGGGRTYLTDLAGSTVALGDASGALKTEYGYDPYGGQSATGEASTNGFTYTGRENDGTGLMYYRARYYSPTLQRFISEDPIGFAGGANLYGYAASSPTNYTDPSGNNPMVAGCVVGGLTDGLLDWGAQRLSGRKVDWGWGGVGGAAALGCAGGAFGAWLGKAMGGGRTLAKCNSFDADTPVKMQDGSTKRIADVQPGDMVQSVPEDNPHGTVEARRVQTVISGRGEKSMVRISTAGGDIDATDGHPFWLAQENRWARADELRSGQWLRTLTGTYVQITAVSRERTYERVYNLTVEEFHTYYALAGNTPVLVHNCNSAVETASLDDLVKLGNQPGKGGLSPAGRAFEKHVNPATRDPGHIAKYDVGRVTTNADKTLIGNYHVEDIMTHPSVVERVNHSASAHYGGITRDFRLPVDGRGVRWSMRGGVATFEGFL
jgi:RHS repeat-associated protein